MSPDKRVQRLRRLHTVFVEVGLIASLLLLITAFRLNYRLDGAVEIINPPVKPIELVPIEPTKIPPKPPPPPVPPVPVVVPNDTPLEDEPIAIDSEIHISEPARIPPPPPTATGKDEPGEIFVVVEDYPKPIGGMEGILSRVVYPEIARKAGIEGRVIVQFVIEKDGTVSHADVLKGIGAGCDEAALRAVRDTHFTPGMQRKKPVRVKMTLPIVFRLKG